MCMCIRIMNTTKWKWRNTDTACITVIKDIYNYNSWSWSTLFKGSTRPRSPKRYFIPCFVSGYGYKVAFLPQSLINWHSWSCDISHVPKELNDHDITLCIVRLRVAKRSITMTSRLKRKLNEIGIDTASNKATENFCLVRRLILV